MLEQKLTQSHEIDNPTPFMGVLASGEKVWDQENSHTHIRGPLLAEALKRVDATNQDFLVKEVKFDEQVGYTTCVATSENDEIQWAYRLKRKGPTRFVLNREPEPSNSVTVVLRRPGNNPNKMLLVTAWIGVPAGPEPWDKKSTQESRDYWANHALIWGSEPTVEEFGTFVLDVADVRPEPYTPKHLRENN